MSLFTPSAKVPSHFPCSLNFHQRTNEDVTGEGNRAYVKTVTDLFVRSRPGLWSGGSGGFRSRWQRPTRRLRLLPRPGTRHGDTRCSYWDGRHADALRPRLPEYRAASLRQTRTGWRNVSSKTRRGIQYQRGWLARLFLAGIAVNCNAAIWSR